MDYAHREVVNATFLAYTFPQKVGIAVFLDSIVVKTTFNLVADTLNIAPGPLNVKRVIEIELLMHHAHTMISPHMKEPKFSQLTCPVV